MIAYSRTWWMVGSERKRQEATEYTRRFSSGELDDAGNKFSDEYIHGMEKMLWNGTQTGR